MNTQELDEQLQRADVQIANAREALDNMIHLRNFLLNLPLSDDLPAFTVYGTLIDFDNLDHPSIIKVIQHFPGKWKKTPTDDAKVHYTLDYQGVNLRCYAGTPPANCQIVEETVEVPAQPARFITKRKLVCSESKAKTPIDQVLADSGIL